MEPSQPSPNTVSPQTSQPLKPFEPEPLPKKQSPLDTFLEILTGPMTKQKKMLLAGFGVVALIIIVGSFWIGFHGQQSSMPAAPTSTVNGSPTPTDVPFDTTTPEATPVDSETPTATPTGSPTPTTTPTNIPTPTNVPFTVTGVSMNAVTPTGDTTSCNAQFTFSGNVNVNGSGEIQYHWEQNVTNLSQQTLTFPSNLNQQTVSTTVPFTSTASGSMILHVTYPNDISSSSVTYNDRCTTQ